MKRDKFQILFCSSLILLSGCVVGNYSRVELSPTDSGTDTKILQTDVGNILATLDFLPLPAGKQQPTGFVADWMLSDEGLSQSNCVAEWFHETGNRFWGWANYSVEMFVQNNAIIFIILTDESGSRSEVEKIETVLTKMVGEKFPNLKTHVIFHHMITAEKP